MVRNYVPAILLSALLLLVPLGIIIENLRPDIWNARLWLAMLVPEPNRHTPQYTNGTYLPPVITKDTTLTASGSPIVVAGTIRVPAGVTLTIEPGTAIYAAEFSEIDIEGTLRALGTAQTPITLSTNEVHPLNQVWNGLIFRPGSAGTISYTTIAHGAPAISCLATAVVQGDHLTLTDTLTDVFTTSPRCAFTNSVLRSWQDGVIAIGFDPTLTNTKIFAARELIRKIASQPVH